MLEAAGLAAPDGRYGGIIGVERRVVWYDLDAPIWRTPSSSGKQKMRSTMEVYDFEFDFRLDIIAVAQQHVADPSVDLLVVPIRIGECDECPWWDHCRPQLEAGSGDVSLIPRVGWREWKAHHDRGVTDRAALASLDIRTAQLVAAGVDVAALVALAADVPPETPIAELPDFGRRPAQLARLERRGDRHGRRRLEAGCDDRRVLRCRSLLAPRADRPGARGAWDPLPCTGGAASIAISVPEGDVEVDVDMENVEDGVYLWGALLTDRSGSGEPDEGYHPFVTWDPLTPEVAGRELPRVLDLADGGPRGGGRGRPFVPRLLLQRVGREHVPAIARRRRGRARRGRGVHRLGRVGRHAPGLRQPADHRAEAAV